MFILTKEEIRIPVTGGQLAGELVIPEDPIGVVIFSHGSGSSRLSPRNNYIANKLQDAHIATFLLDLLTEREDEDLPNRFNIDLLSGRLILATMQLRSDARVSSLPVGYFGASTGAASALHAAAWLPDIIQAVVSRGGRPDLALAFLPEVKAPTLFIVGSRDAEVLALNKNALALLHCKKELVTVKGAGHLFEEEGTLDEAGKLAVQWFSSCFKKSIA